VSKLELIRLIHDNNAHGLSTNICSFYANIGFYMRKWKITTTIVVY